MAESVKVLHLDNCIARVHYPEVTEEEREEQIKRLKQATAKFLLDAEAELIQEKEKTSE